MSTSLKLAVDDLYTEFQGIKNDYENGLALTDVPKRTAPAMIKLSISGSRIGIFISEPRKIVKN